MIKIEEVAALVKQSIPDAEVEVQDLTGGGDHFEIRVVSPVFSGKMLIDQHRIVQQALGPALSDGRIHAIQIKTKTPSEQSGKGSGENDLQIIK